MRERSAIPDPDIDREEEAWWNDNAATIESIWAMSKVVRPAVRSRYLNRARDFFLDGLKERPGRVLEVGCGSGWLSRIIADRERLHVIGLDIAAEQIRLAKENAATAGLSDVCEYRAQNLADFTVNDAGSVSCVFIHAILHHLSWQEIHSVLGQLKALGAGTKLFVYEPVYLSDPDGGTLPETPEALAARALAETPVLAAKRFQKMFRPTRDMALVKKVESLAVSAHKLRRILSPKEVVFRESELLGALGEIGEVTERYLCNFTSMPVSQIATTFTSSLLQRLFCATVLKQALRVDQELFEKNLFPLITRQYAFMGYHCVIR